MKILNMMTNKSLESIAIYLTLDEIKAFIGRLEDLQATYGVQGQHYYLNDKNYKREIMLSVHDENDPERFKYGPIAMKLIREEL
jgi:hypothetical protein